MTAAFNVSMLLTADASQAKREIAGAGTDLQQFGTKARQAGTAASAGLKQAETEIVKLRTANAAVTGNLVAQFNDVGQMLAAGQSPLLLAAQQGTQITQALGNAGAASAAKLLGSALRGLFNPVNLGVYAAIAGAGMLVQWLRSSAEETRTVEDAVGDLTKATDAYQGAVDRALTPMSRLRREWGDQAVKVRELYQAQLDLQKLDLTIAVDDALTAFRAEFDGLAEMLRSFDEYTKIGGPLKDDALKLAQSQIRAINAEFGLTIIQATQVRDGLQDIASASGPAQVADGLAAIRGALMSVRDESGLLPRSFAETAKELLKAELEARRMAEPLAEAEQRALGIADIDMASGISAAAAEALLLAKNLGISLATAREITGAAAEAGQKPRLTFGLGAVADPIIAGKPGLRFGPRSTESGARGGVILDYPEDPGAPASRGGAARAETDAIGKLIERKREELELLRETDPVQQEMLRHREALAGATAGERAELEALITTQVRAEAQAKASREAFSFFGQQAYDSLDGLIFQGEKLSEVFANVAEAIGKALLQSALLGTGPLAGIFGGQGTGLFDLIGGAFGGGGGDLFNNIVGLADGGMVTGPGGPRDDRVLSWLSNGEYVVNAAATARHRPLLEAINGAPRFASGGIVGGGRSGGPIGASGPIPILLDLRLSDDIDARIAQTSEDVSLRVMKGGIDQYDRKVLPKRLRAIQADPRRAG